MILRREAEAQLLPVTGVGKGTWMVAAIRLQQLNHHVRPVWCPQCRTPTVPHMVHQV